MNILKKAAACLAAAAVMASMAVTASAAAPHMSVSSSNNGNCFIQIGSFPSEMDAYDKIAARISFGNYGEKIYDNSYMIIIDKSAKQAECFFENKAEKRYTHKYECTFGYNDFGIIIEFELPKGSETLAEVSQFDLSGIAFMGVTTDENGGNTLHYYSYENEAMDDDDLLDGVDYMWFDGWKDKVSEFLSEPISSEPASEPASSEPESEPANEPVSSEPASEPASSETTTSQPSNVDTGTAGVAAVVGTALLAAGAVIVTRKKK